MTRLQAIRALRSGQPLTHAYLPDDCGTSVQFQLTLSYREHCDFKRRYQEAHHRIGPLHASFWSGGMPHQLHISPKQLLGWIKRTYSRN